MKKEYIKHFNHETDQYLLCRPDYPSSLFDYFAQLVNKNATVWDCGTGNGQAAKALAQRFSKVIATDINQNQLNVAERLNNIEYICSPAEHTPIPSASIDLTTIAQALHWFNFPLFYNEVKRVSKPEGLIATWCYSLGTFNSPIDEIIKKLYFDILGTTYWPKERFYIDEKYKTIPFPFKKMAVPDFEIHKDINFHQLIGYLSTWSAVKEFETRQQYNPLDLVMHDLQSVWGSKEDKKEIVWPIHCLLGKVHGGISD